VVHLTPGPKEPTTEQFQHHLKITIDELLYLYNEGTLFKTPKHPEGVYYIMYHIDQK